MLGLRFDKRYRSVPIFVYMYVHWNGRTSFFLGSYYCLIDLEMFVSVFLLKGAHFLCWRFSCNMMTVEGKFSLTCVYSMLGLRFDKWYRFVPIFVYAYVYWNGLKSFFWCCYYIVMIEMKMCRSYCNGWMQCAWILR
jgi:hypothetical protein